MTNFTSPVTRLGSKPATLFFAMFLICGLLFILLTPPYQMPDEPAHFMRSVQILQGQWRPQPDTPQSVFPAVLEPDVKAVSYMPFNKDTRFSLAQLREQISNSPRFTAENFSTQKTKAESEAACFFTTTAYSPVPYIPLTAAVFFAQVFALKAIYALYLARLAGLLCAALLITTGFELIRRHYSDREAGLYAMAAFIPMQLALAACASADSMTNALAFLATGLGLALYAKDGKPDRRLRAAFITVSALLGLCKYIYLLIPLALELGILLKDPRRRLAGAITLFIVTLAPAAVWSHMSSGILIAKSQAQAAFVKEHPLQFLKIAAETLVGFKFYIRSITASFGWLDAPAHAAPILSYFGAILGAGLLYTRKTALPRVAAWLGMTGLMLTIMLGCYLAFTPAGLDNVIGVQGRYFLPGIALFLLALPALIQLTEHGMKIAHGVIATLWLTLMFASLYGAIWKRYWS